MMINIFFAYPHFRFTWWSRNVILFSILILNNISCSPELSRKAQHTKAGVASDEQTSCLQVIGGNEVDLGVHKERTDVVKEVELVNTSEVQTVVLSDIIRKSCGCTSCSIKKHILLPGEKTTIRIEVRGDEYTKAPKHLSVTIPVKEPGNHPSVQLTMKLHILPRWRIYPEYDFTYLLSPGQTQQIQLYLIGPDGTDIKLNNVSSSLPDFQCSQVSGIMKRTKPIELNIDFTAPEKPGRYQHEIIVRTDEKKNLLRRSLLPL